MAPAPPYNESLKYEIERAIDIGTSSRDQVFHDAFRNGNSSDEQQDKKAPKSYAEWRETVLRWAM
jgi:hypothetical protein